MASGVIGSLRVNLGLDSAEFARGAKSAQSSADMLGKRLAAFGAVATAAVGAIGAAAIAGANRIDDLAKSARRVDSSIGGFRALEMAAGEAGVSVDTLADAVQTMDREIAKGSTNAESALRSLNITAQDLEGLEADQKMALIGDSIQKMGLSTAQTSVVLQQLGVRNREMVLALGAGGEAFRSARADVESYGLSITSIQSDKIEAANDAIGRLGLISEYAGQQLALKIVPALGAMAQAMTDSLREGGLLRTMIDGVIDNLDRLAVYAATAAAIMGGQFVVAFVAARGATVLLAGAFGLLKKAIFTTGIGALVVVAGEAVYQFGRLVKATGSFGDALGLLSNVASEVFDRISMAFDVIPLAVSAGANKMAALFFDALRDMMLGFQTMINSVVAGLNGALGTSLSYARGMGDGLYDMANAASAAATAASGAGNAILGAVTAPLSSVGALRDAVAEVPDALNEVTASGSDASGVLDDIGGGGGKGSAGKASDAMKDAAKSAKELADEIEQLEFDADPLKKYNAEMEHLAELSAAGLSDGAYAKAVQDLNDELADSYPLINDVSDAFGDFVAGGLSDFNGFVDSILGSFKSMLSEMISTAARNKIMLSMGIGGGGVGAAASAMGGASGVGAAGAGIMGSIGSLGSVFMNGATGVGSALMSGGLSAGVGQLSATLAGATSSVAGFAAAAGAVALPLAAAYGAFKLITGSVKTVDGGFRLIANGSELLTKAYKEEERSRFAGLSKSSKTSYSVIDDSPFSAAYAEIYAGAEQASWALGMSSKALKGYTDTIHVSTKGMSDAEAQAAVSGALIEAQNGLAGEFFEALGKGSRRLIADGEEIGAAMQRVGASVSVATGLIGVLGQRIDLVGLSGAKAATSFVNLLGGLESAAGAVSNYINTFYSAEEKLKLARSGVTDAIGDMFNKIPETIQGYKNSINNALENGNTDRAAKLIGASSVFAEWVKLKEEAKSGASSLRTEAELARDQRQAAYRTTYESLKQRIWQLTDNTDRIREAELASLTGNNIERQKYIYRLEDEAAALEKATQVSAERMGIQRQIWQLEGNEAAIRKDALSELDASNVALQKQYYALVDQKAAQEALTKASDDATSAIKAAVDALEQNNFASMFDYQKAAAYTGQGLQVGNATTSPFAPAPAVTSAAASTDNVVVQLKALNDRMARMETETRQYRLKDLQQGKKTSDVLTKWDADGQPGVRA